MPRVKIDCIVSFSSEDPEHPASNLLRREVCGARWQCAAGAREGSVLLQLARAVCISAIEVGAHNAALVEVLGARSEAPHAPGEVLVPRSVLLSPAESRRGERVQRVRSFTAAALAPAAARPWDRLRVLVTQPYTRAAGFGLSFVHVFEPEPAPAPALALPPTPALALPPAPAPALALPPAPAPALALPPEQEEEQFTPGELFAAHRRPRDTGAQIRHASRALESPGRSRDPVRTPTADRTPADRTQSDREPVDRTPADRTPVNRTPADRTPAADPAPLASTPAHSARAGDTGAPPARKRRADTPPRGAGAGVLAGVVFVLSGYEHPRRGAVRAAACALGAEARAAWTADCTHLVCAFPNTPKLRAARAAGAARAVRAEWVEACARAGARLPWRRFATCAEDRASPPSPAASDSDTDDEIERVRRAAPAAAAAAAREAWECADTESEGEGGGGGGGEARMRPGLAAALAGRRVAGGAGAARLLRALGAHVLHEEEEEAAGAVRVRGARLWAACAPALRGAGPGGQ